MTFSHCLLLSRGHTLYSGPGGLAPAEHFTSQGMERCPDGYNVADWLLEVASGPESAGIATAYSENTNRKGLRRRGNEKTNGQAEDKENSYEKLVASSPGDAGPWGTGGRYATTFMTQFEILAGREWKNLKRCHLKLMPCLVVQLSIDPGIRRYFSHTF
jgi:ATP-binding cassette, subfamily G (WHITE), member 2